MVDNIYFVTTNPTKILHARVALAEFGIKVTAQKVDLIEPRAENPEDVAEEKAIQALAKINRPLIVEDSGIFIQALNGFPKTFVRFVTDTIGVEKIIKMMADESNRNVEFHQSLAYIEPGMKTPQIFSYIDGGFTLADRVWDSVSEPGSGGFDAILIPPGETKPLCMFSKEWRAKRDMNTNRGNIHYHQLARWLSDKYK